MTPTTEAELAQMIAGANGPLRIKGGGTRSIGHVEGDEVCTAALSGISLYEPGALTIVAGAGTPIAEIEKVLSAENQRLAFEPMDHRFLLGTTGDPTLGGMAAANVSGPRRISVGACRDFMLGVRFVDGHGTIIKNGGRVMKNVTGYDLVKLMAGSYGTLGVLTEVALKVLPKSRHTGMLTITGLADADAVRALSRALASPYEVTGAAHLQKGPDGAPLTLIRIEGFENSISYRAGELQKLLAPFGTATFETDADQTTQRWREIRDVAAFHDAPGDVWRISVKPSDAPDLVAQVPGAEALYDWGGGLIWLRVPQGTQAGTIRAALRATPGHATLIRGDAGAGAFQPLSPAIGALHDGLRARFDPKGLFNPGLMDRAA